MHSNLTIVAMSWQIIIENILKDFRLSHYELAAVTGITRQAIHKIIKGQTIRPNQSTIRQLENGLNIKIDEENFTYSKKGKIPSNFISSNNTETSTVQITDSLCRDMQEVQKRSSTSMVVNYPKSENCYAFQISNNDNSPELKKGDFVLFDFDQKIYDGNMIGVILRDGRNFIGEFRKVSSESMVITFKNQEPIVCQNQQILSICKIVRSWRNY